MLLFTLTDVNGISVQNNHIFSVNEPDFVFLVYYKVVRPGVGEIQPHRIIREPSSQPKEL